MAKPFGHVSEKHEIIIKTNARIVGAVGAAAFIFVFSIFASKALVSQSLYQGRIIKEKNNALDQLRENKKKAEELKITYTTFVEEQTNVLGGTAKGSSSIDGDNAKLILDALPSEYDYPGLASSMEKILTDGGYTIESVGGSEDASLANPKDTSKPLPIPYPIAVSGSAQSIKDLLETLEKSIRPMYIDILTINSNEQGLRASIDLHTYFMPAVKFTLEKKEVR